VTVEGGRRRQRSEVYSRSEGEIDDDLSKLTYLLTGSGDDEKSEESLVEQHVDG
jgi:hypothetical protein